MVDSSLRRSSQETSSPYMIEIKNLTKWYGAIHAVKDINFHVHRGEVVGFLGPNGAGKSTTMKIITGYMAPSEGEVRVAGYDVFENPLEVKRHIGYLPETPPLYADMYVRDYLSFAAKLKGVVGSSVCSKVDLALEKAGLEDVQKRLIQNLSKGYKQRVGLAQALVSEPELLILDEPTVGLDPKQVAEIRHLIQRLKGHHTIVLSTHILPEVQATCERIVIINKGQIVAEDSLEKLQERVHGARHFLLRVRRPSEGFVSQLNSVAGVERVESLGSSYELVTDGSGECPSLVAQVAIASGGGLLELRAMDLDLEQIFLKLTSQGGER